MNTNTVTIETKDLSSAGILEHLVGHGERGGSIESAVVRRGHTVVVEWVKILRSGRRSHQTKTFFGADAEVAAKAFAATKWAEIVAWLEKL